MIGQSKTIESTIFNAQEAAKHILDARINPILKSHGYTRHGNVWTKGDEVLMRSISFGARSKYNSKDGARYGWSADIYSPLAMRIHWDKEAVGRPTQHDIIMSKNIESLWLNGREPIWILGWRPGWVINAQSNLGSTSKDWILAVEKHLIPFNQKYSNLESVLSRLMRNPFNRPNSKYARNNIFLFHNMSVLAANAGNHELANSYLNTIKVQLEGKELWPVGWLNRLETYLKNADDPKTILRLK